eukprot:919658-Rhodomonas_salina.1
MTSLCVMLGSSSTTSRPARSHLALISDTLHSKSPLLSTSRDFKSAFLGALGTEERWKEEANMREVCFLSSDFTSPFMGAVLRLCTRESGREEAGM